MKVNKYGAVISFLLALCFGLPPIWLPQDWLVSAYFLAIFGGCILSLFICIVNYLTYKRENLRAVAVGDFSLEYNIKFLVAITTANKDTGKIAMSRKEVIDLCETIESACKNELEKIDVCIDSLFFWNRKWKSLLMQYRKNLKENIYDKSCDLQIFMVGSFHQHEIADVEQELYKYMVDLTKYNSYESELKLIRKWTFGEKMYKSKFEIPQINTDDMKQNFKKKLKEQYGNK